VRSSSYKIIRKKSSGLASRRVTCASCKNGKGPVGENRHLQELRLSSASKGRRLISSPNRGRS